MLAGVSLKAQEPPVLVRSCEFDAVASNSRDLPAPIEELFGELHALAYFEFVIARFKQSEETQPQTVVFEGQTLARAEILPALELSFRESAKKFFAALEQSRYLSRENAEARIRLKLMDLNAGLMTQNDMDRFDRIAGVSAAEIAIARCIVKRREGWAGFAKCLSGVPDPLNEII